jgi:hypothetical protein
MEKAQLTTANAELSQRNRELEAQLAAEIAANRDLSARPQQVREC